MKICEDCIKKDVCKFREKVEGLKLKKFNLPEPLQPELTCPYKKAEPLTSWVVTTGTTTAWDKYPYTLTGVCN